MNVIRGRVTRVTGPIRRSSLIVGLNAVSVCDVNQQIWPLKALHQYVIVRPPCVVRVSAVHTSSTSRSAC